jgi:hypothetical protein
MPKRPKNAQGKGDARETSSDHRRSKDKLQDGLGKKHANKPPAVCRTSRFGYSDKVSAASVKRSSPAPLSVLPAFRCRQTET